MELNAEQATRWITSEPLDLDALLAETADPRCGALAIFGGLVREQNDGRPVSGMTYDAHVVLAAKTLAELELEVRERFGVEQCRIVHRTGPLQVEEASVYVVVRSAHRRAGLRAAEYAIDTLKERLPVWKEEHYVDGPSRFLAGTALTPTEAPADSPTDPANAPAPDAPSSDRNEFDDA